jgi:hypothetical protein
VNQAAVEKFIHHFRRDGCKIRVDLIGQRVISHANVAHPLKQSE